MSTESTDYAQGWRPSPGDKVSGQIVDIAATDGGYGVYPIVTLRSEDGGEVAVHAFHTVLRRELARRRPVVGDELEITYLGKQQGKSGTQGYDGYRVRSNKDTVGYNWDQELAPEERAPAPIEPDVPIDMPAAVAAPVAQDDDDELPF